MDTCDHRAGCLLLCLLLLAALASMNKVNFSLHTFSETVRWVVYGYGDVFSVPGIV